MSDPNVALPERPRSSPDAQRGFTRRLLKPAIPAAVAALDHDARPRALSTLPAPMTAPALDLSLLPGPAQKVLSDRAPAALRAMAAKGVLPGAKPDVLVTVLAALSAEADESLASTARQTLEQLPRAVLQGAFSAPLQSAALGALVEVYGHDPDCVAAILRQPELPQAALVALAQSATEAIGELIATNEVLLLRYPAAIEALYMNKRVRMSTADRVLELAVRHRLELSIPAYQEAAAAIQNELILEPTPEPTFDDLLFRSADELAHSAELDPNEDTHEDDEQGEETLRDKFLPLYAQINQMTISQKIRRAILGTSAERMLLVRDTNRLVASAAASSPMLNENDAARIAANRNVIEDVLRIIAQNRAFTRNYQVKLNLVSNPKTPLSFSSRMLPHLRDNDLRALTRNKNAPANIQALARQHLMRKQTKKA